MKLTRRILLLAAAVIILPSQMWANHLHGGGGATTAITLNDVPASGQIFQRTGTTGAPLVSGTYTGGVPNIECQVRLVASPFTIIASWTRLTTEMQAGGVWSGYGPVIPQSGDIIYKFEVRCANNHAITQAGVNPWGIGALFPCHGQSNMGSFFSTSSSTVVPVAGTYIITGDHFTPIAGRSFIAAVTTLGDGLLTFLNNFRTTTGVCCCAINVSVPATNIDYLFGEWWNLGGGGVEPAKQVIAAFFNSFEAMIWLQGENQFQYSPNTLTNESYLGWLQTGMSECVALAGRAIKFLMISIGRSIDPAFPPDAVNNPNQQQNYLTAANLFSNFYYIACNMDCTFAGGEVIHWDAASGLRVGQRAIQSYLNIIGASGTPVAPFFPTSGAIVDATHTDITLTMSGGTDFTPTTGIANFDISEDGFTWLTGTGVRQSATVVRVATATPLGTACRFWRHAWSTFADPTNYLHDNSTIQSALNYSVPIVNPCTNNTVKAPVLQSQVDQTLFNGGGGATLTGLKQRISAKNGDKLVLALCTSTGSQPPATITITPDVGSPLTLTKTVGSAGNGGSLWEVDLSADINLSTLWTVLCSWPVGVFTVVAYSLYVLPGYGGVTSSGNLQASGTSPTPPSGSLTTRVGGITIAVCTATVGPGGVPAHSDAILITGAKAFTQDTAWAGTICSPVLGFGASVNNPGGAFNVSAQFNGTSGTALLVAAAW